MTLVFIILIIIAAVLLSLVVLVQNPKGGGLAGNVGGFSNQFMGVKQTTDVLERLTWVFAGLIAILCIASTLFIGSPRTPARTDAGQGAPTQQAPAPAGTQQP